MKKIFSNRTIWITGASGGIGEALAILLSKQGAQLILSARRLEELERVNGLCGGNAFVVPIDLADEHSIRKAWEIVHAKFESIDFLFNNGGISQRGETLQTELSTDRKIMEVNFFGNILLAKLVGAKMSERKSGHIIVTSSLLGKWGFYLRSAYAASKHALHGFYESMRMEVEKDNVFITLVLPGFTKTDISKHALNADGKPTQEMDNNQAGGLTPEEVAHAILRGVESKKFEIVIGGKEAKGVLVKRLFPSLFEKILRKQSAKG